MPNQMSKISNGLRSIGLELTSYAQTNDKLRTSKGDVELFDNGNLKSTFDIMSDLYPIWEKLNEAERSSIALDIGKKTQAQVFTATMNNYSQVLAANEVALMSNGSATAENARYMESLAAKINLIKASFENLVLGEGGLSSTISMFLDITQAVLDFANSGLGQLVIKVGLAITAFTLLNTILNSKSVLNSIKWFDTLKTTIGLFILQINGATASTITFKDALTALSLNKFTLIITAIVAAVSGAIYVYDQFNVTLEEQREIVTNLINEIATLESSYASLESDSNRTSSEETKLKLLEALILAKKELLKLEQQEEYEKYSTDISYSFGYDSSVNPIQGNNGGYTLQTFTQSEQLEQDINRYEELNGLIERNSQQQIENSRAIEDGTMSVEQANNANANLEDIYIKLAKEQSELFAVITEGGNTLQGYKDTLGEISEEDEILLDNILKLIDAKNDDTDVNKDVITEMETLVEEYTTLAEEQDNATSAYDDAINAIGGMEDSFTTLNDAINEYNSTGKFSLDTLDKLLTLDNEYLALLQFENGQVKLNEQSALALANARIDEAQATAIAKAQAELDTIAKQAEIDATYGVGSASSDASIAVANAAAIIQEAGIQAVVTANSLAEMWAALENTTSVDVNVQSQIDSVQSSLYSTLITLDNVRNSLGNYTTAVGSGGGSGGGSSGATGATNAFTESLKKQKEALEEVQEALEEEIDEYETVIDYIKDSLEEEQEAVEELKDVTLEAIEEKIDALEEEKEAFEENVQAKIDAIEEEKDSLLTLKSLELDLLEAEQSAFEEMTDSAISAMEERITAEEEYWDSLIAKIEEENDLIEENITLQELQADVATAQATKVMVLEDGQFVYKTDDSALSATEEALAEYERELAVETQIAELEALKEEALESLTEQLTAIEEYTDGVNSEYEEQVQNLQDYIKIMNYSQEELEYYLENHDNNMLGEYQSFLEEMAGLYTDSEIDLSEYNDNVLTETQEQAIALAQSYLAEVETLEKEQEAQSAIYQQQIDDLQAYYDEQEEIFDTEIQRYEDVLDDFDDMLEASAKAQAEILTQQLLSEADTWDERIENLSDFVAAYEAKQKELEDVQAEIETITARISDAEGSTSSSGGSGGGGTTSRSTGAATVPEEEPATVSELIGKTVYFQDNSGNNLTGTIKSVATSSSGSRTYGVVSNSTGFSYSRSPSEISLAGYTAAKSTAMLGYATGVAEIKEDEIAFTNDNPNDPYRELVIGSKYNKSVGTLTSMPKGSGVVNAESTKTLAGIFNSLGSSSSSTNYEQISNNSSESKIFNISNLNIEQVDSTSSLVDELIQFSNKMILTS